MTPYTQQAIEDAVKGGWKPYINLSRRDIREIIGIKGKYFHFLGKRNEDFEKIHICEALCDPDFWSALGKARGWRTIQHSDLIGDETVQWKVNWHRFIDHLAEGKDIESFFATISTNN